MSAIATSSEATGTVPVLRANGRTLDPAPNRLGRLAATPSDRPMGELHEQFRAQGYLWLKRFLDPDVVRAYRAHVLGYLAAAGVIRPGTDPAIGIGGEPLDRPEADRRLMTLVRSARYEAFCMRPELIAFMDSFLGGLSYLHRRKIMRYTLAGSGTVTPAHYDLVYLRGGTTRIVTAWIPIGDTPAEMGGLVYLEGSHQIGVDMERDFSARAAGLSPEERVSAYNAHMTEGGWVSKDLPDMAERFDTRWLAADYEAGDVVLHSPYMIHASTTNEDGQRRVRLSTDIRYQNVEDEIDARWSNHWTLGDML
jgi:ectoine hydroxylase-related dioxygenase (phytanoyl-CoA dioxygenase family)